MNTELYRGNEAYIAPISFTKVLGYIKMSEYFDSVFLTNFCHVSNYPVDKKPCHYQQSFFLQVLL